MENCIIFQKGKENVKSNVTLSQTSPFILVERDRLVRVRLHMHQLFSIIKVFLGMSQNVKFENLYLLKVLLMWSFVFLFSFK